MATNNAINAPALTTNGQLLIGNTGTLPSAATLTAGLGISITNGAGSITIAQSGGTGSWTEVTGTSQALSADNGYIANNAALVTLTLPATFPVGASFAVMGKGAGGFKIAQNAGQSIHVGSSTSTVGAAGFIASTQQFDSVYLVAITANTELSMLGGPQGNITVA